MPDLAVPSLSACSLRFPEAADAQELAAVLAANRMELDRWSPHPPDGFYTGAGQVEQIRQTLLGYEAGAVVQWVIRRAGRIVGDISLFLINRGPLPSATVGYRVDAAAQGQGIATAALIAVLPVARNELESHRLEAGASPPNPASTRVLEKAGFTLIGLAPRYLLIGNEWRDQVLYQRLLDDTLPG